MGRGLSKQQIGVLKQTYRGHFMRERNKAPENVLQYGADMMNWELFRRLFIRETPSGRVSLCKSVARLRSRGFIIPASYASTLGTGCNITAEGISFVESTYPDFASEVKASAAAKPWSNKGGWRQGEFEY